jgi:signal peptidase I
VRDASPPPGRRSSAPRHLAGGANGGAEDRAYPGRDGGAYPGPQARPRVRPRPTAAAAAPAAAEDDDASAAARPHPPEHGPRRSLGRTVVEWVAVILGGIVIALVVEAFLVQAFWIPSVSMSPTLEVGDRVLVNKLAYKVHDVHRGDVVVFSRPKGTEGPDDNIKDLIKRVVAVGGDTIEARDGRVYVNDELIDEPYLPVGTRTDDLNRQSVPKGKVFVMGDNRTDSQDSRIFGPIDEDTIVGRAFVKVLPLTDLGWL